jgi:hypothetical protein
MMTIALLVFVLLVVPALAPVFGVDTRTPELLKQR